MDFVSGKHVPVNFPKMPPAYSKWAHRNGLFYRVLGTTNVDGLGAGGAPQVVYYRADNRDYVVGIYGHTNTLFSMPLQEWFESMTRVDG